MKTEITIGEGEDTGASIYSGTRLGRQLTIGADLISCDQSTKTAS